MANLSSKVLEFARCGRGRPTPQPSRSWSFSAIVAVCVFLVVAALASAQPDRARTEALARRATERLQALQREADRLASQEQTLLGELRKLEIERQLRSEELKRLANDATKIGDELAASADQLQALQSSQRAQQPELRARLVEIYKLGHARYLRLILSTPDLQHLGRATRTVAVLAKLDRDRVASHQLTLADLQRARATLEERGAALAGLRAAARIAHTAADRAAEARQELVRDIDRRRDLNAQLEGELQTTQLKLQAMLRDLPGVAAAPAVPAVENAASPMGLFRGDLPWPATGEVKRRLNGSASKGIEIAAAEGADALAIHDGVVAFAGTFSGFGNLVILDHGSRTFSLYGDLLEIAVKKGARIEHGVPVGSIGPTPAGNNGLYFELRVDGQPVDPLQWLKKR